MRRTRPDTRSLRGFSLVELVVAMVVLAILLGAATFFAFPIRQAIDVAVRADLTDIADTALQRIGRDVRLALPNSVRINSDATNQWLEFLAIRTAGRYRADSGGAAVNTCADDGNGVPASDQLSFDVPDSCFKTIGKLPFGTAFSATDQLVLSNYGEGFTGQDAYASAAPNRAALSAIDTGSETGRDRVTLSAATTFQRSLHDSPGRRFFVISGPVAYHCNKIAGTVTRYSGGTYVINAAKPGQGGSTYASGVGAVIATQVSDCQFDYAANVGPSLGLLSIRLTLSKSTSSGAPEVVSLYHAIHVNNVP